MALMSIIPWRHGFDVLLYQDRVNQAIYEKLTVFPAVNVVQPARIQ
jgi:hypothetical protein